MGIYNIAAGALKLEWWQTEVKEHPEKHIGPLCVTTATTLLVGVIWGRYQALGFVCLAVVSYPFAHYQIEYLLFLDVHETAYAVVAVGIHLFCMQFSYLSQWGLPMSIALEYSRTVRGMRIRQILQDQGTLIDNLKSLQKESKKQIDLLSENADQLNNALKTLARQVLKKKELAQVEQNVETQKQEAVVQIETDYAALNAELKSLTDVCNKLIEDKGLTEQLNKMDDNAREIEKQNTQINFRNKELEQVTNTLKEANQKFKELNKRLEEGLAKDEAMFKEWIKEFHRWVLSTNKPYSLM